MNDRIEEYRCDWVAGPAPRVRKPITHVIADNPGYSSLVLFLVGLCVATLVYIGFGRHASWEKQIDRLVKATETKMEMATSVRLLNQYRRANNALPANPTEYLAGNLKNNKPYPRGYDFWGTPYRVDLLDDGYALRSAGPDKKFNDADDLVFEVKSRERD